MIRNRNSKIPARKLAILRLEDEVIETSAPYQALSLPLMEKQEITICTYFKTSMLVPEKIAIFDGDDTLFGFFRALGTALEVRRYDIIHVHTPHLALFYLFASLFRSDSWMRSTVYTVHNSFSSYRLRNKLLLIPALAFFRQVVCCSNTSFESIPWVLKWLAGNRLCAIQNGVDVDRIDGVINRGSKAPSERLFTVASVGRIIDVKRPLTVLRAFHKSLIRDSNLVFIGDGYLRERLVSDAEKLGVKKDVNITGVIARDDVYERLAQADVVVSASRIEGLPVAILEAMACRCPVILSDIPSHREIVGDADFVPLISLDDDEGFAREIEKFRSMPASERDEVGERCRELVEERFSLASTHSGYERVYLQLIGNNGHSAPSSNLDGLASGKHSSQNNRQGNNR